MAEENTQNIRFEELVTAVEGGKLTMTKFLWKLVSEIEEINSQTPQSQIRKMKKEVDGFLKDLKNNPAKDGKTASKAELIALIKPLIPKPKPGKAGLNGATPTRDFIIDMIDRLIPDPIPGEPGKKGKTGIPGKIPAHRWTGTFIEFQNPDGSWGDKTNLQGVPSESVEYGGPGFTNGLETILGAGFKREGVNSIYFGDNLTITRTNNGVRIDAEAGGSGGTGLDFETPTGTIDDSNVTFTVTETPLYLVINGAQYFEGVHYTLATLTITLNDPVGTGGFIRSAFGTGITVETPTGTVDDSNVTFTVTNEPKYLVINGAQYFDGAGYSYAGGTVTLDNPVGTGGFIRSVY